jgi:hypothetical protein
MRREQQATEPRTSTGVIDLTSPDFGFGAVDEFFLSLSFDNALNTSKHRTYNFIFVLLAVTTSKDLVSDWFTNTPVM